MYYALALSAALFLFGASLAAAMMPQNSCSMYHDGRTVLHSHQKTEGQTNPIGEEICIHGLSVNGQRYLVIVESKYLLQGQEPGPLPPPRLQ